jgi:spore germination protein KA
MAIPALAVNLLFVLLWLLMRRWYCLLSVAAIAVRYTFLGLFFQIGGASSFAADGKDAGTLQLLSFNVHQFGGAGIESRPTDSIADAFLSLIREERPDVLCSKLIEGRVALLVDGVPYAIVIPRLFCESFQTLDDYAYKPYYATFIRWLKYGAFLIAVLLPSFYVAIVMYHPELLNSTLFMLLVDSEKKAPLSIVTEAFFVLIMYEVIREAGVRLPKPVGGAVSIISGLIIGDAAVNSGLVSTPLLTMTALSVLGGLVVPELNPQVTVLRFVFLAAGGALGLFGISLLACGVLVNICATEDYGFPYMAPLSPFKRSGMGDTAVRSGIKKLQSRGFTVEEYHE